MERSGLGWSWGVLGAEDAAVDSQARDQPVDLEVRANAAAVLAEWSALKAKAQSLVLARWPDKPNWLDIRGVTVSVDAHRGFTVKAAYDAQTLPSPTRRARRLHLTHGQGGH